MRKMRESIYTLILVFLLLVIVIQYSGGCAPAVSSQDTAAMIAEMKIMNQKLSNIEAGITTMKDDVSVIKVDVGAIKGNVDVITKDVANIKGNVSNISSMGGAADLLKLLPR